MPNPQNIAKASNRETSQSVKGAPFSLLISCATPEKVERRHLLRESPLL